MGQNFVAFPPAKDIDYALVISEANVVFCFLSASEFSTPLRDIWKTIRKFNLSWREIIMIGIFVKHS